MKMVRIVFAAFLSSVLIFGIGACAYSGIQLSDLTDITEIDASPNGFQTTIYDKSGNKVDTLAGAESNRVYITLDEIPKYCQDAFIAIEDERFYEHNGIDIRGIGRAIFQGIKDRKFSQGASTITQQLIKNNVLVDWVSEDDFSDKLSRKIKEQYLAIQLEREYSKEWILENYLNTINLGGGTRGIQVAAQYYFLKDPDELTIAESALIAGITKNPTNYNPMNNPEKSLERQRLVLKAMLDQELITQEEYDAAIEEDVIAHLRDKSQDVTQVLSWFEDALLNQVVEDLQEKLGYTKEDAWDYIYSGGLTINSTMDEGLQDICQQEVAALENGEDSPEVSVVILDSSDGSVSAIIGGKTKDSSLSFNRAISSVRQPGSLIKVIGEYSAAIDTGTVTLGTVVDDAPYSYSDGTKLSNSYTTYGGMTTIRKSIAESSNVVALKTFQMLDEDVIWNYINNYGITTLDDSDRYESLAIGGTYNGVTNLEITAAYNAISADGLYTKPYYYYNVTDHDGNVILSNEPEYKQVISSDTAKLLTLAMEDVIKKGTGTAADFSGTDIAGKSGTTNDLVDGWFVGYSSDHTCGVWGGYDSNKSQDSVKYVKTLWKSIMSRACEDGSSQLLVNTDSLAEVKICSKCGKRAVSGLCDEFKGDSEPVVTEYYAQGTAPVSFCDCHERVTICTETNRTANSHCPDSVCQEKVVLKSGTADTVDAKYVLSESQKEVCDTHKFEFNFFDWLWGF